MRIMRTNRTYYVETSAGFSFRLFGNHGHSNGAGAKYQFVSLKEETAIECLLVHLSARVS